MNMGYKMIELLCCVLCVLDVCVISALTGA